MGNNFAQLKRLINFFRTVILPARISQLILQTFLKWQKDNCMDMGAALAYYALFSLFPICLVMLSIAGRLLGSESNYYLQLISFTQNILPEQPFTVFQQALTNLNQSSFSAGIIGFGILVLTSSRIFDALNQSVNKIWAVVHRPKENAGVKQHAFNFIRNKILAFLLVLSTVMVFLLSIFANLAAKIILTVLGEFEQSIPWITFDSLALITTLQTGISYFVITAVIITLFKVLPPTRLQWWDIFPGAILTAAAMMVLQNAVGSGIIRIGENLQAYGVVGNVMVLLLWIYLIFQVFFIGCEFTFVFTYIFGSRHQKEKPF
ncbi:YihY/virulence factor BrkB family protein [Synechocystis sp. PCC 7338]|uniref:YihY/virulence factor BrkB family protein n=1 Tax=Synechocystis sp. PCC 7338 TaxID=2732530 RepID=UPI001BB0204A|nr:YihY/virulence factor BrkB family protein [Synechocystis sp. PCC 7338]QUS60195.1 YihY/virulence factor BrkB family protein [Synechocystis sp. PCC 7338]